MPTSPILKASFYPCAYYHLVCKSIDGLLLFNHPAEYSIFQLRFKKFTAGFFDVWSYCLLPNHTHHVIKIKSTQAIAEWISQLTLPNRTIAMKRFLAAPDNEAYFDSMIKRQMNSFLVSYANYMNNRYERKGGLFQKPFKRILIEQESHLQQAVIYTHANAQKHQMTTNYKEYPYCSYWPLVDQSAEASTSVMTFFKGRGNFILLHDQQVAYFYGRNWPSSKLE